MSDRFNKLPVDPDWLRKVNEFTERAADELGCMVLVAAIQPNGKMAVGLEGVPPDGPLHEMAKSVPQLLASLAVTLDDYEQDAAEQATKAKPQ